MGAEAPEVVAEVQGPKPENILENDIKIHKIFLPVFLIKRSEEKTLDFSIKFLLYRKTELCSVPLSILPRIKVTLKEGLLGHIFTSFQQQVQILRIS